MEKRGSFYTLDNNRLGQGRENVKTYLQENPEICTEIERRIRQQLMQDSGSLAHDLGDPPVMRGDDDDSAEEYDLEVNE